MRIVLACLFLASCADLRQPSRSIADLLRKAGPDIDFRVDPVRVLAALTVRGVVLH